MQFTLTVELGNDAMRRYSDLRWAAKELVRQLESEAGTPKDGDGRKLRDINGNTVGSWEVSETPAEQADGSARLAEVIEGADPKPCPECDETIPHTHGPFQPGPQHQRGE